MVDSPISATVDFEAEGVQHGHLLLPHSRDDSAWGAIRIPICVAKRGDGPTALITGGNHGDEYEGPIALFKLAAQLEREDFQGRVILVPGLNYPALRAGKRTSPLDGGNLNRSFPGSPTGGPTAKIADYVQRTLLPLADLVLDIHSGGKSLDFLPFAAIHTLPDKEQQQRCRKALDAFGAPISLVLLELDALGMLDTAVEELGKVFVSTELGGGGTARTETVAVAERGIRGILQHLGILPGAPEPAESLHLDMPDGDCYALAETGGLLEPCVDLGAEVREGDLLARIWDWSRTGGAPEEVRARRDGLLVGRRFPGSCEPGDCLAVLGVRV
jgi:N-alpha-acetyl-L-2,4-diaminobutyrate deacetylase